MATSNYNHIPQVMGTLVFQTHNVAKDTAGFMKDSAQGHAPVLFGYLRLSIDSTPTGRYSYQVSAQSKEAGAPREYAHYVEYGTRYTPTQPYMRPAYIEGVAALQVTNGFGLGDNVEDSARSGRVIT